MHTKKCAQPTFFVPVSTSLARGVHMHITYYISGHGVHMHPMASDLLIKPYVTHAGDYNDAFTDYRHLLLLIRKRKKAGITNE